VFIFHLFQVHKLKAVSFPIAVELFFVFVDAL